MVYNAETPPDLAAYAKIVRDVIAPLGVQIILEPGRLLVGEAGLLLTRVVYVKEGDNRRYLILDAGMNDLIRPALYEAYHPIRPVDASAGPKVKCDIVGPICETGDTFAKDPRTAGNEGGRSGRADGRGRIRFRHGLQLQHQVSCPPRSWSTANSTPSFASGRRFRIYWKKRPFPAG